MELVCLKDKYYHICQPQKRKRQSWFPKWYCFRCRKYVLPDKFHRIRFDEKEGYALRVYEQVKRITKCE